MNAQVELNATVGLEIDWLGVCVVAPIMLCFMSVFTFCYMNAISKEECLD